MMRGYGYGYGNMMGGTWFGIVVLLFWLLVIAGVVLLIVWGVRQMSGRGHQAAPPMTPPAGTMVPPAPPRDDACDIARVRYAKGEITKEQFDEIMQALGS